MWVIWIFILFVDVLLILINVFLFIKLKSLFLIVDVLERVKKEWFYVFCKSSKMEYIMKLWVKNLKE